MALLVVVSAETDGLITYFSPLKLIFSIIVFYILNDTGLNLKYNWP